MKWNEKVEKQEKNLIKNSILLFEKHSFLLLYLIIAFIFIFLMVVYICWFFLRKIRYSVKRDYNWYKITWWKNLRLLIIDIANNIIKSEIQDKIL